MFILFLPALVYSQENDYSPSNFRQTFNYQVNWLDDFNLYFSLNNIQYNINNMPLNNNPKTIGLWTSYAVSKTSVGETMPGETKLLMLNPLNIKYREDSKFNSLRYILGIAQTAAVGYMAYIHIKKYGFFK